LDFVLENCKKSLVFLELISELLIDSGKDFPKESLINEDLLLITSFDPWYGDILVYVQTLKCPPSASFFECRRIRHQA
jgi:hypothetical protein